MDLVDVIDEYMNRVQAVYATDVTTEHSFRPALEYLFKNIDGDVQCINEPKQVTNVGRPDFSFKRKVGHNFITIGHCEAKDIDKDVDPRAMKDANKNQYNRYIKGLPNLIYTNGLDFRFYVKGEFIRDVSIADFAVGITPKKRNYQALATALKEFAAERLQTITSAKRLAELMAGKAILIKTVLGNSLIADADLDSDLAGQYKAFKKHLIHDLTPEGFADIYAETVVYGMFAARLKDKTKEDFSRQEALELLPKSNPFLRSLFTYVAGADLDERIIRDIDELAEIFLHVDPDFLFKDFGHFTKRNDPFIHFYETFLAEYNPKKRKARGVWYTPEPVVNFIVRAVDDVLKTEFSLPMGLADTSKVVVPVATGQTDKKGKPVMEKRELHRVQILDPATGTGTFLAEVIKQIAPKVKDKAAGQWSNYVEKDLIPRVHGFELLMASYAMCHMKLDMMLKDMDYEPTANPPRLSVYLTNSLEEGDKEVRDLFMAKWLSNEAKAANEVKHDKPIMCIIGNPPYSGESANKGDWIMSLMEAYKKEPGGKEKLKERNPKWINDDYVKFIRMSEHMIEQNGEGVLAFITNHGYLDNPTFRGMRWHLLKTFDKIHVLDLHGNTKKQEVSPNGSPDKNVFDIQQGVSIIIGMKKRSLENKKFLPSILQHGDLWGTRSEKNADLFDGSLNSLTQLQPTTKAPQFPYVPRDWNLVDAYINGFHIPKLFQLGKVGMVTSSDKLTIGFDKQKLFEEVEAFANSDENYARETILGGRNDVRDWKVKWAQDDAKANLSMSNIRRLHYRPLDVRWTFYTGKTKGIQGYPRHDVMKHFHKDNFGLVTARSNKTPRQDHFFVSGEMTEAKLGESSTQSAVFPLYLYPDEDALDQTRRVNFDPKIHKSIVKAVLRDAPKGAPQDEAVHRGEPDEVAIFDYIYGVLHCPAYRETYAEFLKIDFPRIPYPPSADVFWDVSEKGTALRRLHLMEPDAIGEANYPFQGTGESVVEKPKFTETSDGVGTVHINKEQYFENVPRIAWEFYVGGYQPAQKWLKDRKGRALDFNDILHYQNIIKILCETDRIMKTITMPLD